MTIDPLTPDQQFPDQEQQMTQDAPTDTPIETGTLEYDTEPEHEWLEDEPEELPRRPRRKLLSPVPLTLLVILLLAGAFFAGVQVEKGQSSSTGTSGGLPSGLAALRSRLGAGTAGASSSAKATGASSGFPGASGAGGGFPGTGGLSGAGVTTGEVSFASGNTLYVTGSEGNTVKVSAPDGTKVSKTVTTNVHGIHPGDTVVVTGSKNNNGSVSASSITISSSGASSTGASGSSSTSGSAAQQLFGAG
jgi:hypothetical protein